MDKLDKDMKLEKDNLSEATVPDEALDQVAGGSTYDVSVGREGPFRVG